MSQERDDDLVILWFKLPRIQPKINLNYVYQRSFSSMIKIVYQPSTSKWIILFVSKDSLKLEA